MGCSVILSERWGGRARTTWYVWYLRPYWLTDVDFMVLGESLTCKGSAYTSGSLSHIQAELSDCLDVESENEEISSMSEFESAEGREKGEAEMVQEIVGMVAEDSFEYIQSKMLSEKDSTKEDKLNQTDIIKPLSTDCNHNMVLRENCVSAGMCVEKSPYLNDCPVKEDVVLNPTEGVFQNDGCSATAFSVTISESNSSFALTIAPNSPILGSSIVAPLCDKGVISQSAESFSMSKDEILKEVSVSEVDSVSMGSAHDGDSQLASSVHPVPPFVFKDQLQKNCKASSFFSKDTCDLGSLVRESLLILSNIGTIEDHEIHASISSAEGYVIDYLEAKRGGISEVCQLGFGNGSTKNNPENFDLPQNHYKFDLTDSPHFQIPASSIRSPSNTSEDGTQSMPWLNNQCSFQVTRSMASKAPASTSFEGPLEKGKIKMQNFKASTINKSCSKKGESEKKNLKPRRKHPSQFELAFRHVKISSDSPSEDLKFEGKLSSKKTSYGPNVPQAHSSPLPVAETFSVFNKFIKSATSDNESKASTYNSSDIQNVSQGDAWNEVLKQVKLRTRPL